MFLELLKLLLYSNYNKHRPRLYIIISGSRIDILFSEDKLNMLCLLDTLLYLLN